MDESSSQEARDSRAASQNIPGEGIQYRDPLCTNLAYSQERDDVFYFFDSGQPNFTFLIQFKITKIILWLWRPTMCRPKQLAYNYRSRCYCETLVS